MGIFLIRIPSRVNLAMSVRMNGILRFKIHVLFIFKLPQTKSGCETFEMQANRMTRFNQWSFSSFTGCHGLQSLQFAYAAAAMVLPFFANFFLIFCVFFSSLTLDKSRSV